MAVASEIVLFLIRFVIVMVPILILVILPGGLLARYVFRRARRWQPARELESTSEHDCRAYKDKDAPISFILITSCMVPASTACSGFSQSSPGTSSASPAAVPKITSESVVKVAVKGAEIPSGGFADAIAHVTVQSGYHINSNPPTFPYLKATELDMAETNEISLNSIFYPKPLVKKFAFSEEPIHVYEESTRLTVSFRLPRARRKANNPFPLNCTSKTAMIRFVMPPVR